MRSLYELASSGQDPFNSIDHHKQTCSYNQHDSTTKLVRGGKLFSKVKSTSWIKI